MQVLQDNQDPNRNMKLRFNIFDDFAQVLSLTVFTQFNNQTHTVSVMEWTPYDVLTWERRIFANFPRDYGQELIDNLWSLGYRPTAGRGSAGSFEAQGAHLRDLQRYFYNKEGINGKD